MSQNQVPKWIQLNNEIMIQQDGKFQFDKDKEAVHSYFVDYINQNTVLFKRTHEGRKTKLLSVSCLKHFFNVFKRIKA